MEYTDALSLADGFLLGKDDGFSAEFKDLVRKTGVTHIVAASGANLVFLENIFLPFILLSSRRVKKAVLLLGCLFYFFIAGASGSLWRATVMWVSSWGGLWFGRRTSLVWLLFQVLLITAVFSPEFFDSASFWLSWLAMVGVYFSRQEIFREKIYSYFPYIQRVLNYLIQSFFTGWLVFVMVTVWLWTQYQVFQPHGIVVTWGIEPVIPAYMVAGLHWRFAEWVCGLWAGNPLCELWPPMAVRVITLLYWPIEEWLLLWQGWLSSPSRNSVTTGCLLLIGCVLSVLYFRRWSIKSNLVAKWKK